MPRHIHSLLPLLLGPIAAFATGCAIAGDYHVPAGSTQARSYASVAGSIEVGREATIRNAKTVAGNIEIQDRGRVGSLSTVAGSIHLAPEVKVEGSVKTVAGSISISRGCTIAGNVSTVAGSITVTDSIVSGDVTLDHGDLDVTRSRVAGTVRIRNANNKDSDVANVTIGPNSEVTALVVDDKANVRLNIHRSAKVGSVTGAKAEYYE